MRFEISCVWQRCHVFAVLNKWFLKKNQNSTQNAEYLQKYASIISQNSYFIDVPANIGPFYLKWFRPVLCVNKTHKWHYHHVIRNALIRTESCFVLITFEKKNIFNICTYIRISFPQFRKASHLMNKLCLTNRKRDEINAKSFSNVL